MLSNCNSSCSLKRARFTINSLARSAVFSYKGSNVMHDSVLKLEPSGGTSLRAGGMKRLLVIFSDFGLPVQLEAHFIEHA